MIRAAAHTLLVLLVAATASGAEKAPVKVGDTAPDLALKDQDGKVVRLRSFRGKKNVVIAFYPKDFTGG